MTKIKPGTTTRLRLVTSDAQEVLAGAKVAVLGNGSLGGLAGWFLASAGVGELLLADRDTLSADNLRRHVCGDDDLPRAKAPAVARLLRRRFASSRFAPARFCFLDDPERLRRLLARADLAVVAVDQEGPKFLIEDMSWSLGRPVVYAGVYGGGWGMEVVLVDPARGTPCYGCAATSLGRRGMTTWPRERSAAYAAPTANASGDWSQADLSSIAPAAALAGQVATARLKAAAGLTEELDELLSPGVTAWRFAFRRHAALGLGPWRMQGVHVRRQEHCPLCGTLRPRGAAAQLDQLLQRAAA